VATLKILKSEIYFDLFNTFSKNIHKKTEISHLHKYSDPLLWAVEAPVAAITASSLLGTTLQAWHTCSVHFSLNPD
jgi:hypothetical protein